MWLMDNTGNCNLRDKGIIYLGNLKKLRKVSLIRNIITTNIYVKLFKNLINLPYYQEKKKERVKISDKENRKKARKSIYNGTNVWYMIQKW